MFDFYLWCSNEVRFPKWRSFTVINWEELLIYFFNDLVEIDGIKTYRFFSSYANLSLLIFINRSFFVKSDYSY